MPGGSLADLLAASRPRTPPVAGSARHRRAGRAGAGARARARHRAPRSQAGQRLARRRRHRAARRLRPRGAGRSRVASRARACSSGRSRTWRRNRRWAAIPTRADLYALGALLYEMLCGPAAVPRRRRRRRREQHLHTAPVMPSWHRAEVAAAIDDTRARAAREGSGRNVRRAPRSSPSARGFRDHGVPSASRAHADDGAAGAQLRGGPTGAASSGEARSSGSSRRCSTTRSSGRTRLAMLVGEPGIGKTRLVEELGAYAAIRGAQVLWGHCYEGDSACRTGRGSRRSARTCAIAADDDLERERAAGCAGGRDAAARAPRALPESAGAAAARRRGGADAPVRGRRVVLRAAASGAAARARARRPALGRQADAAAAPASVRSVTRAIAC